MKITELFGKGFEKSVEVVVYATGLLILRIWNSRPIRKVLKEAGFLLDLAIFFYFSSKGTLYEEIIGEEMP